MSEAKQTGEMWLDRGGVRPTRQRVTLAKLLVGDGHHRHVTAESLFDAARASGERVSLATVYNTLRAFSEAGLLREITVNGSKSYFDNDALSDADAGEVMVSNLPEPPEGTEIERVDVVIRLRKV